MNNPKISVIMSVYNGEKFIKETIDSILSQTFKDFEYIIVDDASTDQTQNILKNVLDSRIKIITNKKNLGQTTSRNIAIGEAKGKYIAITDADDISYKNRLKKQYDYMESHPEIDICGSFAETIGEGKKVIVRNPTNTDDLKVSLLFRTSLTHSTVIIKKKFLDENHIGYEKFPDGTVYGEDFDLYVRSSRVGKISNIPEVLVKYRKHSSQVTQSNQKIQIDHSEKIIASQLQLLNIENCEEKSKILAAFKKYSFLKIDAKEFLEKFENLVLEIIVKNKINNIYNEESLKKISSNMWLEANIAYSIHGKKMWKIFWNSPIRKWQNLSMINGLKIAKLYMKY